MVVGPAASAAKMTSRRHALRVQASSVGPRARRESRALSLRRATRLSLSVERPHGDDTREKNIPPCVDVGASRRACERGRRLDLVEVDANVLVVVALHRHIHRRLVDARLWREKGHFGKREEKNARRERRKSLEPRDRTRSAPRPVGDAWRPRFLSLLLPLAEKTVLP